MLHKIVKIVAALISLVGIVSLIRIIAKGDEEIEAAALTGDTAIAEPMAWASYIMLGLVLAFVIIFVLKNLFTNKAGLKNTLVGVGTFVIVLVIAYAVSGNDPMQYILKDDIIASDSQSHIVGAGLVSFYILLVVSAGAMVFAGAKRIINK